MAEGVFSLQGAEQQEHGTGGDLPSPGMMTNGNNHTEASGTGLCGQASEAIRDTPERPRESLEVGENLQHTGGTGNQQKACAVALVASFMHASGGHQGLGCLAKASDQCSLQRFCGRHRALGSLALGSNPSSVFTPWLSMAHHSQPLFLHL